MPLVKLKEIAQDTWLHSGGGPSAGGVCYEMCNFLESDKGIWSKPDTFNKAVEEAATFGQGTAMMGYAKARTLRKAPFDTPYPVVGGALSNNRIYRVQLWVGDAGDIPGEINHEMIVITGGGNEVAFYEPNFGFYEAKDNVMNNREAVEFYVNELYEQDLEARAFTYFNVRAINRATPLGFPAD